MISTICLETSVFLFTTRHCGCSWYRGLFFLPLKHRPAHDNYEEISSFVYAATLTSSFHVKCSSSACCYCEASTMPPSSHEVYWLFRLAQIVFQYLILMLIGAAVVYTVKRDQLCPPYSKSFWVPPVTRQLISFYFTCCPVKSFPLIRWFVHGKLNGSNSLPDDVEMQLLDPKDDDGDGKNREKMSSTVHKSNLKSCVLFIYCFSGLQLSFLVWGIFQEKIMTTDYPWSSDLSNRNELVSYHPRPDKIRFRNPQVLILISRIFAFITAVLLITLDSLKSRLLTLVPHIECVKLIFDTNTSNTSKKNVYTIAPFYKFSYCSLSNVLSSWCQYEALKYVNFPTQVVSKACKLIPVMLMSYFVSGKRYKLHEYYIAVLISIGCSFFLIGNHIEQSKYHTGNSSLNESVNIHPFNSTAHNPGEQINTKSYSLIDGLLILSLYLTFDSFTSNWQKKLMKDYGLSSLNTMASVNLYSIIFAFSSLASQALIVPSIEIIFSCDELLRDCLILSISSVSGQLFLYYTISRFGPVTFTLITTIRQPIAIILSCFIYGHSLNLLSYSGITLAFAAVFFKSYFQQKQEKR